MRSDDLTSHLGEFRGDMRTFAKHHAIDRYVLRHFLIFFCCVFIFMPLFGDTCRDELNLNGGVAVWASF